MLFTVYHCRTGQKLGTYDVGSHEGALDALWRELIVEGPVDEKGHSEIYVMATDEDEATAIANQLASALGKQGRLEHLRGLRKRRPKPPLDHAEFDTHVEAILAADSFSSVHALREHVGCNLARLRQSLDRLTRAGRIKKESGVSYPHQPCWRVTSASTRDTG